MTKTQIKLLSIWVISLSVLFYLYNQQEWLISNWPSLQIPLGIAVFILLAIEEHKRKKNQTNVFKLHPWLVIYYIILALCSVLFLLYVLLNSLNPIEFMGFNELILLTSLLVVPPLILQQFHKFVEAGRKT